MAFQISHTVVDGIERIVYTPDVPRFATPIVMQHGMWHGAWAWQPWQELLAAWGWECHAHSLPGHGQSPVQRPIRWCTLQYYFEFLVAEIKRLPRRPVVMGHSMGGALIQWYLKYGGDLPAAVLVAPWLSHTMNHWSLIWRNFSRDPVGYTCCFLTLSATPMVRNPRRAAEAFVTEGAIMTPAELHARLGPESGWVLLQYRPPFWSPVERTNTPLLWLAGERDALIAEADQRQSADYYGADYVAVRGAGHNLMLERSYRETAETIQHWLVERKIS